MELQSSKRIPAGPNWEKGNNAWLETAFISVCAVALAVWIGPVSERFAASYFTWWLLAPMIVSMRYGLLYGLACASTCVVTIGVAWLLDGAAADRFPVGQVLVLLFAALVSGELSNMWRGRLYRVERSFQAQRERFEEFARNYQLLRLSHTRLEQKFMGNTASLRSALYKLRQDLQWLKLHDTGDSAAAGAAILSVFRECGHLQTAALHWTDVHGEVQLQPAACLGSTPALINGEPLVIRVLQKREMTVLDQKDTEEQRGPLAAIPLIDISGRLWGLVMVYEMPFFAFKNKALDGLAILGGHVGDLLMQKGVYGESVAVSLRTLNAAITRCQIDFQRGKIASSLISVRINSRAIVEDVSELTVSFARCIDQRWLFNINDEESVLMILLPLTDQNGATHFAVRLKEALGKARGTAWVSNHIQLTIHEINRQQLTERLVADLHHACREQLAANG